MNGITPTVITTHTLTHTHTYNNNIAGIRGTSYAVYLFIFFSIPIYLPITKYEKKSPPMTAAEHRTSFQSGSALDIIFSSIIDHIMEVQV